MFVKYLKQCCTVLFRQESHDSTSLVYLRIAKNVSHLRISRTLAKSFSVKFKLIEIFEIPK